MFEVERDYQFFHPNEPDEMAIVDLMEELYGDPDIAEQMAKEDQEYILAVCGCLPSDSPNKIWDYCAQEWRYPDDDF